MKWTWLTRHNPDHDVDPEVDQRIKDFVDGAEARQPRVDHVVNETRRLSKANHFGPKVASALGAKPR